MVACSYNALIRTHHITSRKKVTLLKTAAKKLQCYVLLRSGGVPGLMYVEGEGQAEVQSWVDVVHALRYKDYQLISAVSKAPAVQPGNPAQRLGELEEVPTVKAMAASMEARGLLHWWRTAMGYTHE